MNSGNSCTNLCARSRTRHSWGTAQSTAMAKPTALCRAVKLPPILPRPQSVPCSSTAHVDAPSHCSLPAKGAAARSLSRPLFAIYLTHACFKVFQIYIMFFPKQSICASEELNLNTGAFIIFTQKKKTGSGERDIENGVKSIPIC